MQVTRKTMTLFSIFILVAMIAVVFIFLYRHNIDKIVAGYVSQITTCENIADEATCYAYDFCAGVYVPECEDCQTFNFSKCVRVPDSIAQKSIEAKKECQEKGGIWSRSRMGEGCTFNQQ